MTQASLGWLGIIRLGLVQTALGAVAVLTTQTMNRVMVVEMALPASLPAAFVAWHYAVQLSRPRWGHGSDSGNARTPWIIGGLAVLALGAMLAANATVAMADQPWIGVPLAILAYAMIGAGVAASGTSLLALLATRVREDRRPAAAAIAWIMMIAGIVATAMTASKLLDPFSPQRLVLVASGVAGVAFLVGLLAVRGIEARLASLEPVGGAAPAPGSFRETVRQVWREKLARDFTIFIFVSMLAYSAQELIIEPYAGIVFHYSLGQATGLAGAQHGGVLLGMILLGLGGTLIKGDRTPLMRRCAAIGCVGSAAALATLGAAGFGRIGAPLEPLVFALGLANGVFAVSAIGLMMSYAGASRKSREGVRVGVWGAAQAIAFGIGGFAGATALDLMRRLVDFPPTAFAGVFAIEALCFMAAGLVALRLERATARNPPLAAAVSPSIG